MIGEQILAAIYARAAAAFPDECCGYLRGPAGAEVVDDHVPCANAAPTARDRGFAIDGAELLAFARTFATPRPARVVYHSHPNGRAYFSATDRAVAAPNGEPAYPVAHLVVGVDAGGPVEAALFAWSAAARDFVEIARFRARPSE